MLFSLGQLVFTNGVYEMTQNNPLLTREISHCIVRHGRGDWGEVHEEDKVSNNLALTKGTRLLSAYTLSNQKEIWIITEWDRSLTTVLFPEEY